MLSIVVASRNDGHGGGLLARCTTFINTLASQVEDMNLSVELIVVDWNPPPDRPLLYQCLPAPSGIPIRYIIVPPSLHRAIENSDKIKFFQMWAKNVGIRRARGDWVLATNIDILFSDEMMMFLTSPGALRNGYFYRATRYDIGAKTVPGDTRQERLAFCRNNVTRIQSKYGAICYNTRLQNRGGGTEGIEAASGNIHLGNAGGKLFTNACGDFQLLHRDMWRQAHGYPELGRWSIHVDTMFMYLLLAAGLVQVILPYPIYHIEHDDGWAIMNASQRRVFTESVPSLSSGWVRVFGRRIVWQGQPVQNNDVNWGLGNTDLEEIQC